MRKDIQPIWECSENCNGGSFFYKIPIEHVLPVWTKMMHSAAGESLSSNSLFMQNVTGVTISPRKRFCVVKIWMRDKQFTDASVISVCQSANNNNNNDSDPNRFIMQDFALDCVFKVHKD